MEAGSAKVDPDRPSQDPIRGKTSDSTFEQKAPTLFTSHALLCIYAHSLILVLPLVLALAAMTLMKPGLLTLLIPLATLAATAYILPFGLGNGFVRHLALRIAPTADDAKSFIVQITLRPRLRSGLRALIEDADDIGILSLNAQGFEFTGDSLRISLPYSAISVVRSRNVGIRGRFLYGSRTEITSTALGGHQAIEFCERSSLVLPQSKRISRTLTDRMLAATKSAAR